MRQSYKTALLWICIIALAFALFSGVRPKPSADFDALRRDLDADRVASLRLEADGDRARAEVQLRGGRTYTTTEVAIAEAVAVAQASGVPYAIEGDRSPAFPSLLATWLPVLLMGLLIFFFVRQLRQSRDPGKSPGLVEMIHARIEVQPAPPRQRLDGLDAARARLLAEVEALKRGGPGARRILVSGAPGSGKSRLLRWLAAEAGVHAVTVPGSDFCSVFVGLAAARVRRLFEVAKDHAPCLAVVEDVDAFAARRAQPESTEQGRNNEQEQALVELCHHLDGVRGMPPGVLFLATTNREDRLDEALTRPGRLDLHVRLGADGSSEVVELGPARAAAG